MEPIITRPQTATPPPKSNVTGLLTVLLILALAIAGLLWFQLSKTRDDRDALKTSNLSLQKQLAAAKVTPIITPSPTAKASTATPVVLKIPEYNVSLVLPSSLTDVTYAYKYNNVYFSSASLTKADAQCGLASTDGAIGALSRSTVGTPKAPTEGDPIATIANYNYYYDPPQSACSLSASVNQLQLSQKAILAAVLPDLQ